MSEQFVIFDLDGTIADIRHRVHHVRGGGKQNWQAFFAECANDLPVWPVIDTLRAHVKAGDRVEIWSARSDEVRDATEEWLRRHSIDHTLLTHMRAVGDSTPDVVLKRYWLNQSYRRPDVVYDDRQRVVDFWRSEDIACFQVVADWESDSRVIAPIDNGPLLTLMVGPSGAGKSTWCMGEHNVISSDGLRRQYTGTIQDQSRNADVFTALHRLAKARLTCGLPTIIDATNLVRRDRLACVSLAPVGSAIRYMVIDRPLTEKIRDGGWRNEVMIGEKTLVEMHHDRMQSGLKHILAGDGLPNVTVVDARTFANGGMAVAA